MFLNISSIVGTYIRNHPCALLEQIWRKGKVWKKSPKARKEDMFRFGIIYVKIVPKHPACVANTKYKLQGWDGGKIKRLKFQGRVDPHDLALASTTIGRNVGPACVGNPAESGKHWHIGLDTSHWTKYFLLPWLKSHNWWRIYLQVFFKALWNQKENLNSRFTFKKLSAYFHFRFAWAPITTSYACLRRTTD